jgi:dienelactone hydrolase
MRRLEATAQGGRGLTTNARASTNEDTHRVDIDGDVAYLRDVRVRPEPRVRDDRADIVTRILAHTEGFPAEARDAVERAVAIARGTADLQAILSDLASEASRTMRDELYWRGAAQDSSVSKGESEGEGEEKNGQGEADFFSVGDSEINFRVLGPYPIRRDRVTFYWPSLGFDFGARRSPWVTALVYTPVTDQRVDANRTGIPKSGFPAVAFATGWNSWADRYEETLTHVASHGFVMIAPTVADRRARPLFSFDLLTTHLLVSLAWLVRESRRGNGQMRGLVDASRLGIFGHSSGAGAALRAAVDSKLNLRYPSNEEAYLDSFHSDAVDDVQLLNALVSGGVRAVAGMGAFLESSGLKHDDLSKMKDVSMFQIAGRRDSHVTPRAIADVTAAAVNAVPRAVAVLKYGTHCFLDESGSYEYPDSQCAAALEGRERYSLTNPRDRESRSTSASDWSSQTQTWTVTRTSSSTWGDTRESIEDRETSDSASVMSPRDQLEATREYLTAFFVSELQGGFLTEDDATDATSQSQRTTDAYLRRAASRARRKLWSEDDRSGSRRGSPQRSQATSGGRGGWTEGPNGETFRSASLRAASPVEVSGLESFGEPPPASVELMEDPRMSRVEVLAWE